MQALATCEQLSKVPSPCSFNFKWVPIKQIVLKERVRFPNQAFCKNKQRESHWRSEGFILSFWNDPASGEISISECDVTWSNLTCIDESQCDLSHTPAKARKEKNNSR